MTSAILQKKTGKEAGCCFKQLIINMLFASFYLGEERPFPHR